MNQKERILELVKQGVITSEEATILLEHHQKKDDVEESVYDRLERQIQECDQQLVELQADIEVLESLEGIAPLTDEQRQHLENLKQQKKDIYIERDRLQIQYYEAEQEADKLHKQEQRRESFEKAKTEAKDTVKTVGHKVTSFVKQTSSSVQTYVKEMVDRKQRTGSFTGSKMSQSFEKRYEFSEEDCQKVNIDVVNGNIHLVPREEDHISIDVNAHLFTDKEDINPESIFLNESILSLQEEQLEIKVPSKDYVVDLTVHLPRSSYEEMNLRVSTGDIELHGMTVNQLNVKDKHGALRLMDSTIEDAQLNVVNGNVDIKHCVIQKQNLSIANGSLDLDSEVTELTGSVLNGMSMIAVPGSFKQLNLKTGNGSIEAFINEQLPIEIQAETKLGNIQNRLSNAIVTDNEVLRSGQVMKAQTLDEVTDESAGLNLNAKTGSIVINSYQHHAMEEK